MKKIKLLWMAMLTLMLPALQSSRVDRNEGCFGWVFNKTGRGTMSA